MFRSAVIVFVFTCLPCIFGPTLHAEQWQTVLGREKFLTISVDLDSLQIGQLDDMIFFKLRADDHDDTVTTRFVQASCSEFSMEVERESVFHKSIQTVELLDWKNDQSLVHHPEFAQSRLSFWGVTQAYGQAISLACRRAGNHAPERLQILQPDNCAPTNPLRKVACASHPSWRANYKLYFSRSHDVIHNCGISEDRMTKQAAWLLKSVMRCQSETCGNEILENWIHKRGQDIAKVIHMQKNSNIAWSAPTQSAPLCESLNQADQAIASMQTEEIYAKAKYMGCLKRETAKLRAAHTPKETLSQQAEQLCETQFQEWHDAITKQSAMLD
ncbi:hypothetical protein [Methylophilus sp. TWE2]|uniref:hypothetical protein n=1 Tax=Methylophilus sp. TWE2 TaxID=1662285 RepID=UPI000A519C02|nr:hypothetical protein [Methylophilus sp. TWE2]